MSRSVQYCACLVDRVNNKASIKVVGVKDYLQNSSTHLRLCFSTLSFFMFVFYMCMWQRYVGVRTIAKTFKQKNRFEMGVIRGSQFPRLCQLDVLRPAQAFILDFPRYVKHRFSFVDEWKSEQKYESLVVKEVELVRFCCILQVTIYRSILAYCCQGFCCSDDESM